MAESTASRIVTELHDEPHIEGRRVTVRRVQALVENAGRSPFDVADELQLDVADVYAALHYYHANPDEIAEAKRRRQQRETDAKRDGVQSIAAYREEQSDDPEDSR